MKITGLELHPVTIPFDKPIKMGGGTATVAEGAVLKIHTDEGITGVCETGDTSMWYMGESQDSIMYNVAKMYAPILMGENPFNIEKIIAKMDKAVKVNNQSKAVVDYVLHDIMGKANNMPVYQVLGGKSNPKIPLAFVMSSGTNEEVVAEGLALVKAGFKALKMKVGANSVDEDVEMVGAMRAAVGPDVKIMTDTNGGWHYFQALRFLKKAAKYDIFLAEQPVPWWDITSLARLRRKVDVPIFADESAAELNDLIKLLKLEAVDGFFLKVPKAGGIHKSQKWVTIAQGADMMVMTGCMVNTSLGAAAEAHFLAATEWIGRVEQESIGPLNLFNRYTTAGAPMPNDLSKIPARYEDGYLYPPEGPGLGTELNEEVMKRLATPGKESIIIKA